MPEFKVAVIVFVMDEPCVTVLLPPLLIEKSNEGIVPPRQPYPIHEVKA